MPASSARMSEATSWSTWPHDDDQEPFCAGLRQQTCPLHAQNGRVEHIVLVGAMGVGKTTVGRELARRLRRPFLDSDAELEELHGETGAEIASREGVAGLHRIELDVFDGLMEGETPSVIAPAASVVDSETGRRLLARNITVWLDAPEEILAIRREQSDHRREVDETEVGALERRRQPHWEALASFRVDTSRTVGETVDTLMSHLRGLDSR